MAYYKDNEEDQQDPSNPGGTTQTGPESGVISPGAPGSQVAPKPAGAPDKSGSFVNLKTYLDANKPQAEKLGDQASGVIQNSADLARQGVSDLNQEAQNTIKPVQSLGQDIFGKINSAPQSLSDQERKQVKDTENASYKGPQDEMGLSGYQNAAKAQQTAVSNINNSGTEQGRMGLVSQINAKPRTQGMNVFDNALLQAGGGREKLAQSAQANQDVKGGLDAAAQNIRNQIGRADDPTTPDIDESSGAIGQTNKAQSDAYNQVQTALNSWKTGFAPKVQQAQQSLVDQQNKITNDLGDNQYQLDPSTLAALGLSGGEHIFGLDLKNYLKPVSVNDINAGNVASPEDYARYAALADLSGDQSNYLNPANAAQAGTAPKFGADQAKLQADIKAAQDAYFNQYNKAENNVLDRTYAVNPNAAGDPWKLYPGSEHMAQDSAARIENYWVPYAENFAKQTGLPADMDAAQAIKNALEAWKNKNGYNKVVNPTKNLPQKGDGSIDWGAITAPGGK